MSVLRLLLREIQHRKLGFLLALTAVVVAIGLLVGVLTLALASQQETTRLMRDLGFNVLLLPREANLSDFWSQDFAAAEMPEDYVHTLAQSRLVEVRHLVARLQKRYEWRGRTVLLTGVLPEVPRRHMKRKPPMGLTVPQGRLYAGHALADALGLKVGDTVELGERSFQIDRILPEKGSKDDIRLYGHLHDVQAVLGRPGRINEIEALSCRCLDSSLETIRSDLAQVLPGTQAVEFKSIAVARAETRRMMEKYAAVIVPATLLAAGLWVGLLAFGNVVDRRHEIGILRAMGVGSLRVAALFIGRAALLGLIGAMLGFALGTAAALWIGPRVFPVTARSIVPVFALLGWSAVGAPLLCAVASYMPAVFAVTRDPAQALREE